MPERGYESVRAQRFMKILIIPAYADNVTRAPVSNQNMSRKSDPDGGHNLSPHRQPEPCQYLQHRTG